MGPKKTKASFSRLTKPYVMGTPFEKEAPPSSETLTCADRSGTQTADRMGAAGTAHPESHAVGG
eukprot:4996713-Prymnesium_polylepis.1